MNYKNNPLDVHLDALAFGQLKDNIRWYYALGIGLMALGMLAVIFSLVSTLVSVLYIGFFIIIAGIFEGAQSLTLSRWSSFFLHLFLSILYLVGGIFIVANPAASSLSLTLLIALFFTLSGIVRIIFSFSRTVVHRGFIFFNGVLTTVLGILIWYQWPFSGLWVIGTLVGIDMMLTGMTWIAIASKAKHVLARIQDKREQ